MSADDDRGYNRTPYSDINIFCLFCHQVSENGVIQNSMRNISFVSNVSFIFVART